MCVSNCVFIWCAYLVICVCIYGRFVVSHAAFFAVVFPLRQFFIIYVSRMKSSFSLLGSLETLHTWAEL